MENKKYTAFQLIVYCSLVGILTGLLLTTNPFIIGAAVGTAYALLSD